MLQVNLKNSVRYNMENGYSSSDYIKQSYQIISNITDQLWGSIKMKFNLKVS